MYSLSGSGAAIQRSVFELTNPKPEIHCCATCGRAFESESELKTHQESEAQAKVACTYCSQRFHFQITLDAHMFECHPESLKPEELPYRCLYCQWQAKTSFGLELHLSLRFNNTCYPGQRAIEDERRVPASDAAMPKAAPTTYGRAVSLEEHSLSHSRTGSSSTQPTQSQSQLPPLPQISRLLQSQSQSQSHSQSHSQLPFGYGSSDAMKSLAATALAPNQSFSAAQLTFNNSQQLGTNNSSGQSTPHTFATSLATSPDSLRNTPGDSSPESVSDDEMPTRRTKHRRYKCPVCNKVCSTSSGLDYHSKTHLKSVEERRAYRCMECPRVFTVKSTLYRHQRTQHAATLDERKPYKCEVCAKAFASRYNLVRHTSTRHPSE